MVATEYVSSGSAGIVMCPSLEENATEKKDKKERSKEAKLKTPKRTQKKKARKKQERSKKRQLLFGQCCEIHNNESISQLDGGGMLQNGLGFAHRTPIGPVSSCANCWIRQAAAGRH